MADFKRFRIKYNIITIQKLIKTSLRLQVYSNKADMSHNNSLNEKMVKDL